MDEDLLNSIEEITSNSTEDKTPEPEQPVEEKSDWDEAFPEPEPSNEEPSEPDDQPKEPEIPEEPAKPVEVKPFEVVEASAHHHSHKKSSKAPVIILTIITILALATAGVFAWLYFENSNNSTPEPVETPPATTISEPEEEVELTDAALKSDLDQKLATLHRTEETSQSFKKIAGLHEETPLYINGDLSSTGKVLHILYSITDEIRSLTPEEHVSLVNDLGDDPGYRPEAKGIDGSVIKAKYLEVFGKEFDHGSIGDALLCGYKYNSTIDVYFEYGGCGGTSSIDTYFYKNKYTINSEHAYVYINAGLIERATNEIYCSIVELEQATACDTITEGAEFTIDQTNYQKFTEYRFIFNKDTNGNYYFSKVEKL